MNRGVDLQREIAEHSESDWVFGAATSKPCLALIPQADRDKYLPKGELQYGVADFMDCASRSPLNELEAKFTYLYRTNKLPLSFKQFLDSNGYVVWRDGLPYVEFSDRFVAVNSGTTRQGNSLKAPLEAIRKQGLIPKSMLPRRADMTWADYHNQLDITPAMRKLGEEFTKRCTINYEKVYTTKFADVLKEDMIGVAGHAWPKPINGVYPRVEIEANHAFLLYKLPEFQAFDNYYDYTDQGAYIEGDFTKNLAPDYYFFDYGYRLYISAINDLVPDPAIDFDAWKAWAVSALTAALEWLKIYQSNKETIPSTPAQQPLTPAPEPKETPSQILYRVAKENLGKDLTPDDKVPDEIACVSQLQAIYKKAFNRFIEPYTNSTATLVRVLRSHPDFEAITVPEKGCIAIFPTTNGVQGHVGIWGETHVLSNTSASGKWEANYTHASWKAAAANRGLPNYFFKRV